MRITGASDSSGAYIDSPANTSLRNESAYWGTENLPPNASLNAYSSFAGGSAISGAGENNFFPTGASGFSFEGPASSSMWDASYRSSLAGSPSLFDDTRPSPGLRQSTNDSSPLNPQTYSSEGSGSRSRNASAVHLWDLPNSAWTSRSNGSSAFRTSSPVGGGRKAKEASRGLRYSVTGIPRDKGLVGLAKPPKEAEQGRVAVTGKTTLKILKVPHGESRQTSSTPVTAAPTPSSSYRSSSIAARRSRSRGSPAPGAIRDEFIGPEDVSADEKEEISELLDVRHGSRLGPAYLFSDVRWGYGATANKLATAFGNGAVVLWDLAKEGSRIDQLKYEHDRAVNRVVFGGQTGNWLLSGGQDGQMKLWDIRESRPASMVLKASSPVRQLSFSPSPSQPFTLVAACASGTLIRYDVRFVARQNGGATDRVAGHIGSCLAMDWRDGFSCERSPNSAGGPGVTNETAGGGREGGWVVTGGVDRTIKIWDFSLPTLSTKPVRTLYASQPVHTIAWHPTRATELASSPMPSLGLGATGEDSSSSLGEDSPMPVTVQDPALTPASKGETLRVRSALDGNAWKNEIEVWDVRRPYFPKVAIKTDKPTAALIYNDDETIWAASRAAPTFLQHDVGSDSYSILDGVDRTVTTWDAAGELAFVEDGRRLNDVPFERPSRFMPPVDAPKHRPDAFVSTVADVDTDFSIESFVYLAENWRLSGKFSDVCEHNARVSLYAGRPDAGHVWATLRTWFDDEPFFRSEETSPTATPPPETMPLPPVVDKPASEWFTSPKAISVPKISSHSRRGSRSGRPSFSSGRTSRRSSLDGGQGAHGDSTSKPRLDAFSEESTASETDPAEGKKLDPDLSSTSSDSEHEIIGRRKVLHAVNPKRLAASLGALRSPSRDGRRSRSSTNGSQAIDDDDDDDDDHASDAHEIVRRQLKATLHDYADRGDSQLCAVVCCVLQDKAFDFGRLWLARVTKTYLDHLRRLDLHIPAAALNKFCDVAALTALTQNTVVFHTACGACGKPVDQPPFDFCIRCRRRIATCCICHLAVDSLYTLCAGCGHGAHVECLEAFASTIADTLTASLPQTPLDHSHPSTPGIATPLRAWLWGEDDDDPAWSTAAATESGAYLAAKQLKNVLSGCPAACGHSPCSLMPSA
ncbi:SEA (Seh1-associated) complex subunit [Rhodotorula toruloides]